MLSITEIIESYFDKADISYTHFRSEDDLEAIRIHLEYNGNLTAEFFILIEDNGETAFVRSFSSVKVPEEKLPTVFSLLADIRFDFRWGTFNPEEGNELIALKEEFVTVETAVNILPILLMKIIST